MKSFSFKILYISIFFPSILYVLTLPILESRVQNLLEQNIRQQLILQHDELLAGTANLFKEIDTNITAAKQKSLAIKLGAMVHVRVYDQDGSILHPNYDRLIISLQQDKGLSPPPTKYFDHNGFFLRTQGMTWEESQKLYFEFINSLKIKAGVSIPVSSWLGSVTLLCFIFMVVVGLYIYFIRASRQEEINLENITQEMSRQFESEKQKYAYQLDQRLEEAQKQLASIKDQEEEWLLEVDRLETEKASLEDELLDTLEHTEEQQEKLQSLEEVVAQKVEKRSKSVAKEEKVFADRFARLYRNLELDKAAVKGFAHLKDEKIKLTAEEMLKRLNDGDQSLKIRRKIAGVAGCDAYELGFGSKGRIYYIPSESKQFRVLRIGTKTTQDKDLAALQGIR